MTNARRKASTVIYIWTLYLGFLGAFWGCENKPEKENSRSDIGTEPIPQPIPGLPGDGDAASQAFSVLAPAAAGEKADKSFEIKVAAENLPEDETWSLYFTKAKNEPGQLLASGITLAKTKLVWDTSAFDAGVYFIYATVAIDGKEVQVFAPGSVEIAHATAQNNAPIIVLTSMQGRQTLLHSSQVVTFTAEDVDGDTLSLKMQYSADDGASYQDLAGQPVAGANHTYSYAWDISNATTYPKDYRYRIRVVASDSRGAEATASSFDAFAITSAVPKFGTTAAPQRIYSLFNSKCASCHPSSSQPDVLDYNSVKGSAGSIEQNILDGSMPQNGTLSQDEIADIITFLWGGQPET